TRPGTYAHDVQLTGNDGPIAHGTDPVDLVDPHFERGDATFFDGNGVEESRVKIGDLLFFAAFGEAGFSSDFVDNAFEADFFIFPVEDVECAPAALGAGDGV